VNGCVSIFLPYGVASPDETSTRLIDDGMFKTDCVFQVIKVILIEVKLSLEDAICHSTSTLEQSNGLVE
jgi:hypothetical protein